jgi:dUTP pyrophosphatase
MTIQIEKNETYTDINVLPKKATERSTGCDIVTISDPEIVGEKTDTGYKRIDYIQYKTNLKLAVQKESTGWNGTSHVELIDYDILAFPRSSVSKYNLILANCIGLIDADYRGEVLLRFKYIWQPEDFDFSEKSVIVGTPNIDKVYKKGDKICQLKATKVENINFVLVDKLDTTSRGEGGFGSTNKPNVSDSVIESWKKNPFVAPERKYSDLIKEKEKSI